MSDRDDLLFAFNLPIQNENPKDQVWSSLIVMTFYCASTLLIPVQIAKIKSNRDYIDYILLDFNSQISNPNLKPSPIVMTFC